MSVALPQPAEASEDKLAINSGRETQLSLTNRATRLEVSQGHKI